MQTAEPISSAVNRLEVRIDPRIELLGIAREVEDYQPHDYSGTSLFWATRHYFLPYKDHPAGITAWWSTDTRTILCGGTSAVPRPGRHVGETDWCHEQGFKHL